MKKQIIATLIVIIAVAAIIASGVPVLYAQTDVQTLSLKSGFNFVSFTVSPALTPGELQQANSTLIEDIYLYSSAAGSFLSLSEGTLSSVAAGKGYIVKSKAAGTVTVQGPAVTSVPDISMKAGFNLVGISVSVTSVAFSELLKGNSALKGLYKWSAAAGSFISVVKDSGGTPQALDGVDPKFNYGESYFMNLIADTVLSFAGGAISFNGGSVPAAVEAPVITPAGGSYTETQSVTITCATAGAAIHYTHTGEEPTSSSAVYSTPLNISADTTIKAIAIKSGMTDSAVTSAVFTVNIAPPPAVEAPVITPAGGTYTTAQSVTITCTTAGAVIHYTADGTTPSSASALYGGAITVSSTQTIKAVAVKSGMTDSTVTIAAYTINLATPGAGGTLTVDLGGGVTIEMVRITAGTFQMGSPDTEKDRNTNEGPVHGVTLSRDFYIGKYEFTQAQWLKIYGSWPGTSSPTATYGLGDNYPAYFISWNDICGTGGFLEKINTLKPSGYADFRLPTEAEWECAARGGTRTAFYWGEDSAYSAIGDYAWYSGNSNSAEKPDGYVHPSGSAAANAFGLYDMAGNATELCSDRWLRSYTSSAVTDPVGPLTGTSIMLRGGSYINGAKYCRSASRGYDFPSTRARALGFRLALSAGQ